MKRFMLFEYDDYNACGGMEDFVGTYDNLQDVLERMRTCQCQNISVYDAARMSYVLHRYDNKNINYATIGALFDKYVVDTLKESGFQDISKDYDNFACGNTKLSIGQIKHETKVFQEGDDEM